MKNQHHIVNRVTDEIHLELLPLMTPQIDTIPQGSDQECKDEIRDLVQVAVDLAVKMRSSSEIYEIISPGQGDPIADWQNVEYILEGAETDHQDLSVAEVRFGALIKRPSLLSTSSNEWEVIERALICAS